MGSDEKWRPVVGWKHYEVSNLGRVRSVDRVVEGRWATGYTVRGRMMKLSEHKKGHLSVTLTESGIQRRMSVARVVAAAWLGFDSDDQQQIILHTNDDLRDNRPENLTFGTAGDLVDVRERRGTVIRGEDVGAGSLDREQVRAILDALAAGATAHGLARKYGVSKPTVASIRDRKTWREVEYGHRPGEASDAGAVPPPKTSAAHSGMIPYGFKRSACGCFAEPDEAERDAHTQMVRWRARGVSFGEIARRLTRLGHRTRTGKHLTPSSVHGLLQRYPTEQDAPWLTP